MAVSVRKALKRSSAHQTETSQLEASLHVELNNIAHLKTFRSASVCVHVDQLHDSNKDAGIWEET